MKFKISVFLLLSFFFAFPNSGFLQAMPQVQTYEQLVQAIREARALSQLRIEQAVNQEKVREAWETGRLIDEHILLHKERADYGQSVVERLANDLGTSKRELHYMIEFARAYPIVPVPAQLTWSKYRELLSINDGQIRNEIAEKAAREKWNDDQLREEIRQRKGAISPMPPVELAEIKPGQTGIYRIIEQNGQQYLDLGFDIYHDLPEEYTGKFKVGDIVKVVKGEELRVNSENRLQLFTLHDSPNKKLYTYKAHVTKVYDGDTFHALIDLGFGIKLNQRLRLRRLNASEIMSVEGKEAKAVLEKTLPSEVIVRVSKTDDQYGRYLVDVFTLDFVSMDQQLLDSDVFTLRGDES